MTTRSEAMQRLLNKRECLYLLDCEFLVTRGFFNHICNSDSYIKCHYFAKRVGELQRPMLWLQELAVHDGILDHTIGLSGSGTRKIGA